MVTTICSIISTLVVIFFFVHNIILQRKNRILLHNIYTYFNNERAILFEKYNNGLITVEEFNLESDILNHKLELVLNGNK